MSKLTQHLLLLICLLAVGFASASLQAQERIVLANDAVLNVFMVEGEASDAPKPMVISVSYTHLTLPTKA